MKAASDSEFGSRGFYNCFESLDFFTRDLDIPIKII